MKLLMPYFSLLTKNQVITNTAAKEMLERYMRNGFTTAGVVMDLCSIPVPDDKTDILAYVLDRLNTLKEESFDGQSNI